MNLPNFKEEFQQQIQKNVLLGKIKYKGVFRKKNRYFSLDQFNKKIKVFKQICDKKPSGTYNLDDA